MNRKFGLPPLAWVMAALLGLASVLLIFGDRADITRPSANSFGPDGVAAFAELARRRGYEVVVDRRPIPELQPGDVAVTFWLSPSDLLQPKPQELINALKTYVRGGGSALSLGIQRFFGEEYREAQRTPVKPFVGKPLTIHATTDHGEMKMMQPVSPRVEMALWRDPRGQTIATLGKIGAGRTIVSTAGISATNALIREDDNAAFFLSLLQTLQPQSRRVVFVEASWGGAVETGLLGQLGPGAVVAFWQGVLVFVLVVFALGKRLGPAEEDRVVQRGGKEFVAAVGNLMHRTRRADLALKLLAEHADLVARTQLRVPTGVAREQAFPAELVRTLRIAENWPQKGYSDPEAVAAANALLKALEAAVRR